MATTVFDKPVGTEIGQLSSLTTSNKTNLVNAINSLNSNFGVHSLGTVTSLTDLQNKLVAMVGTKTDIFYDFSCTFSGTVNIGGINFVNTGAVGKLSCVDASRYSVDLYNHGSTDRAAHGVNANGTWSWDAYALNSKFITRQKALTPVSIPANGAVTVTDSTPVNKPVAGYSVIGTSYNVFITAIQIGTNGPSITLRNISNSAITPSGIIIYYLDI